MNTTVEQASATAAVVTVTGELDASNFGDLIDTGRQLYAAGTQVLVVDLSGLTYMASSGIVALHSLARIFEGQEPPDPEAGWQAMHDVATDVDRGPSISGVRLVAPVPAVDRVLDRTGLKRLLPVYDTTAAALAAGSPG
jgi:anti-anti-sigma regulatory factor